MRAAREDDSGCGVSAEVTFTKQYRAERTSPDVLAAAVRYGRTLGVSSGSTYLVEVGRTWISIIDGDRAPVCAVHALNGGVYPPSMATHPTKNLARWGSVRELCREAEAKVSRTVAA